MNRQRHRREIALLNRLEPLMHQTPQDYRGGSGTYILEGAKRIRLSTHAHQKLTTAGEVFWKQLKGEEPPMRYDYNQPLLQDKFILARDGSKVQVRKRNVDLSFEVLPAGRAYFKHHEILWIPMVPRLVVLYKGGKADTRDKTGEAYVHKSKVGDYVALASMPHFTSATLKGKKDATEEEQRTEATALALAYIKTLPRMVIGGRTYHVIHFDSPVDHVFDPGEPILMTKQHTTFPAGGSSVETILATPRRGLAHDMPELLWRPFNCEADSFSNWQEACVIRMIQKSITKRSFVGGNGRTNRANGTLPLLSTDVITAAMDVIFDELGFKVGEYPFQEGESWRDAGIPSTMIVEYCKKLTAEGMPVSCQILHNEKKIFEYRPDNAIHHICFAAQEDHCYFYKQDARIATNMHLHKPSISTYSTYKVREPFPTERPRPWKEWVSYSSIREQAATGFHRLITKRKRGSTDITRVACETLNVYTKEDDLQTIYEELLDHQRRLIHTDQRFGLRRTYGNDPEQIAGLRICAKNLPPISIKAVPLFADDLDVIARRANFIYRGSSLAKFADDLRGACYQRVDISRTERQSIIEQQASKCNLCDTLDMKMEIDHIVPISAGGTSERENYQAVCTSCHMEKCDQERQLYGSAWNSRLSRDTIESFLAAPTPRQLVYGDGCEGTELDIVSSRSFALQKTDRLPIADILDIAQPYERCDYDYVFIDAGEADLTNRHNFSAYDGPGWVTQEVSRWILKGVHSAEGPIEEKHFVASFTASRHISGKEVEVVYDRMRTYIQEGLEENGSQARAYAEDLPKLAILSMQGRWNCRVAQNWECTESTTQDDAPAVLTQQRTLKSGRIKFMTQITTLGNSTMALFAIHALNTEHLNICKALKIAERFQLKIHGCVVDSILFSSSWEQMAALREHVKALTRPDGSLILQIKDKRLAPKAAFQARVVAPKKSHWRPATPCMQPRRFESKAYGAWLHDPVFAHQRQWRELGEADGIGDWGPDDQFQREAAKQIVSNRGARVSGRGGVGKSQLIRHLEELFKAEGYSKVMTLASTHVQAANLENAATILSHLHQSARTREPVLIVDEMSMINTTIFAQLAEAAFIGAIYVILGDEGQIAPIGADVERWKMLPDSDFMHDLTNGLHVTLRKFRRKEKTASGYAPGDLQHFLNVGELYPSKGECEETRLRSHIGKIRQLYPYDGRPVTTTLCVTNRRRVRVNASQNERDKPAHAIFCRYEGDDKRQQEMWIWPGLEVQAAKTETKYNLKNAVTHHIAEINEDTCKLTRGEAAVTVPLADVTKLFRLTYALTIDSSQARTLMGQVLITETEHPHFSLRRCIVALGRSPLAKNIQVQ